MSYNFAVVFQRAKYSSQKRSSHSKGVKEEEEAASGKIEGQRMALRGFIDGLDDRVILPYRDLELIVQLCYISYEAKLDN